MEFKIIKIFLILFGAINSIFCNPIFKEETKLNLCETPECNHAALNVLKNMDETVNPCENFYNFACGNFLQEATIPDDRSRVSQFSIVFDKIQEQLKSLINEERPKNDPKYFRFPNILYKSCMNTTSIEELRGKPIQEISDSVGGWPVVVGKNWNFNGSWNWLDAVIKLSEYGLSSELKIFSFYVTTDTRNSTRRILQIGEPGLGLPREYLLKGFNDSNVMAYLNFMVAIAVEFGANRKHAVEELKDSLQFEMDMANITMPREEYRNHTKFYNLMTIEEIQKKYSYIEWLQLLNALIPGENVKLTKDERINVAAPSYFEKLENLLQKTSKRTLANYIMWMIHSDVISYLSENFRKHLFEYSKTFSGIKKQQPRWKKCINVAASWFSKSVGSLYIRKYFDLNTKKDVTEIAENIRGTFFETLLEAEWMDNVTRKAAIEKLNKLQAKIAFPNEYLDDNKLAEYYDGLDIDENQYFNSINQIRTFYRNYTFNRLRLPNNPNDWVNTPSPIFVNAFYSSRENIFVAPAGILQEPFFDANRPMSMNYGGIGAFIGHEIIHGFDDEGRQYDGNGNLIDWWQKDTERTYLAKVKCMIDQYGNYTDHITGLKLNGSNSQGENVADNGGWKTSYMAYKKWAEINGPEPKLPALNYTSEQLFWISSTQAACEKFTKESLTEQINLDSHPPSQYRIMGVLKNMKNFAKDFNCPIGSPMNPVEKCEVW